MEINVWMQRFVRIANFLSSLSKSLSNQQNPSSGGESSNAQERGAVLTSTYSSAINQARLRVQRGPMVGISLTGVMDFDGKFLYYTLERVGAQIPAGTYPIELTYSPHFQRDMPLIDNVQNRTAIRVHSGVCPQDSDGCILVAKECTEDKSGLVDSRIASDEFNALLVQLLKAGPQQIEIVDAA